MSMEDDGGMVVLFKGVYVLLWVVSKLFFLFMNIKEFMYGVVVLEKDDVVVMLNDNIFL